MGSYEVTNKGWDTFEKSGLKEALHLELKEDEKDEVRDTIIEKLHSELLTAFFDEYELDTVDKFLKELYTKEKTPELEFVIKRLENLKIKVKESAAFLNREEAFFESGLLTLIAFGADFSAEKFKLSRKDLDELILVYADQYQMLDRPTQICRWRYKNRLNELNNFIHGDIRVFQQEFSSKDGLVTERKVSGIFAHYGSWQSFTITLLKYAEALGKSNIDEIVNWKEYVPKYSSGAFTEAFSFDKIDFEHVFSDPLIKFSKEIKKYPHTIQGDNNLYLPYIDKNNNLIISRRYDKKEGQQILPQERKVVNMKIGLVGEQWQPLIKYEPEELPTLLKDTYLTYERGKSELVQLLKGFNELRNS